MRRSEPLPLSLTRPFLSRWTEKDIDNLRDAIARFAHELDNVSGSLLTRSK